MKLTLRGEQSGDIVRDTLRNNGITNVDLLRNPTDEDTVYWGDYYNMIEITSKLEEVITNKGNCVIVVDEDMDGNTSAYILYKYLKHFNVNVRCILHERNKVHGLTADILQKIQPDELVVVPDAGSNDYEQLESLSKTNFVIVVDHHEIEDEERLYSIENVLCVNNQSSRNREANPHLTGVGMVYRLLQAIDYRTGANLADEHLFEVAVGQISDACNMVDNEVRYLVMKGLKQPKSHLFSVLLEEKPQDNGHKILILPSDIGYRLAPKYNALLRMGTLEERTRVFEILCDKNAQHRIIKKPSKSRKTGKITFKLTEEGDYVDVLRLATKKKKMQNEVVNKSKQQLHNIEGNNISVGIQQYEVEGLSGLIASQLVRDTQKPSLVIKQDVSGLYQGSGRGKTEVIDNFKLWINSIDSSIEVLGHSNAFGIKNLTQEQLDKLIEASNGIEVVSDQEINVDAILQSLTANHLLQVTNNRELFGNGNEAPLIGTEFYVDANKIKYYEKSGFATIQMNGYQVAIFNLNEKIDIQLLLEAMSTNKTVKITSTGRANMSNFMGRDTLQYQVVNVEFEYLDFYF